MSGLCNDNPIGAGTPGTPPVAPYSLPIEITSFGAYRVSDNMPIRIEVIRNEDGTFQRYVAHLGNGNAPVDVTEAYFSLAELARLDPEIACISNDGGLTRVSGIVVYDTSTMPPSETIYLGGVNVTATYSKVPCESGQDYEQRETCYQVVGDPNQKFSRIDWFDKSNLNTPIATIWFNQAAQTYSATAPLGIEACRDGQNTVTGGSLGVIAGSGINAISGGAFEGASDAVNTGSVSGALQSITVTALDVTDGYKDGSTPNQILVDCPDGTVVVLFNGQAANFSVVKDSDQALRRDYRIRATGNAYANIIYTFI